MASFDAQAKSLDRNMANNKGNPQHTIMTAHEPSYSRQRLDLDPYAKKDMVWGIG